MSRTAAQSFVIILLLAVAACTTGKPPASAPYYSSPGDSSTTARQDKLSWWSYRFRINWPEQNDAPDFFVDSMLAHRIIQPVLVAHHTRIAWWRFHRRAARKPPGHQFSFLFYTDRVTAEQVIAEINANSLVDTAIGDGIISKVVYSDTADPDGAALEDMSDPSWPPVIQRTWPSYIMGVSAFWLSLIDELYAENHPLDQALANTGNVDQLLEQYRDIDEEIGLLWAEEGRHALLHHLNAMFGYKPMEIRY